jgi:outer membrane protein
MTRFLIVALLLAVILSAAASAAAPADTTATENQQTWAVGALFRSASIPFATGERTVATFYPFVYYEGERFFFRGVEGGLKLHRTGDWEFSALGRLRFFDIPREYQNQIQGDNMMWGLQARYNPFGPWFVALEAMTDPRWKPFLNGRVGARWEFQPYAQLQLKSSKFNSYYYGLDQEDVSAGTELSVGFTTNYYVLSNLYLVAAAEIDHLDRPVRNASFVDKDWHVEAWLGLGFSSDKSKPAPSRLENPRYLRLAQGWATPSSLADIIRFQAEDDPYDNMMTSLFYGHPLSDTLFGLPLAVYLHSGLVWHWKSSVQDHAQELVIAIKLYYTVPWPIRWKLGAAEGMSWVNTIPYVERTQLAKKGYEPSNLLNFLDFSVDLNIGDIVGGEGAKRWWFGYSIHHRSAIFESAQQFGRIKGGSNFQTLYLQRDF